MQEIALPEPASSGIAGDDHAEVGIGIADAHVRVAFLI
jgi:hypothetical protein